MLNREQFNFDDIDTILENAIVDNNVSFTIYADGKLAKYIYSTLRQFYNLEDDSFKEAIQEYEVYMISGLPLFSSGEYKVFINRAFMDDGEMYVLENDGSTYFYRPTDN